MPRVKQAYNRHADLQKAIYGAMGLREETLTELAQRMGKDPRTVTKKIRDPDLMTLGDLRRICSLLNIPVEDARAAIKF